MGVSMVVKGAIGSVLGVYASGSLVQRLASRLLLALQ